MDLDHGSHLPCGSDEKFFEGGETAASKGLRSFARKIATAGVLVMGIGLVAFMYKHSGPTQTAKVSPSAAISTHEMPLGQATPKDPTACFEKDVAYALGQGKEKKDEWMLEDQKKTTAHECQIWCQNFVGCEFFTFRKKSKRCILSTNRGGKRSKGNKGAISGPRFCPGVAQPCQEYTLSSAWEFKEEKERAYNEKVKCDWTGTLSGQTVKVSTYNVPVASPERLPAEVLNFPGWPKGMEPPYMMMFYYGWNTNGDVLQEKGFNITIEGAPMEDVIVTMMHNFFDPQKSTNATLSQGTWIPVTETNGLFRADLLDGGRTVFLEAGALAQTLPSFRLSKPVSTIAISVSSDRSYLDHSGPYAVMLAQGKKC